MGEIPIPIPIPLGWCQCGCGHKTDLARVNNPSKGWIQGEPLPYRGGHYKRSYVQEFHPSQLCKCGCGGYTEFSPRNNKGLGWVKGRPRDYIHNHQNRPTPARIVDSKNGYYKNCKKTGCWLWQSTINQGGYGRIILDTKYYLAHIIAYKTLKGNIPNGLVLDHLCRTRHCINPEHLEPVTRKENARRGCLARGEISTAEQVEICQQLQKIYCKSSSGKKQYEIHAPTGCWIWINNFQKDGYGNYKGKYAHRAFYELFKGRIDKGLSIDHLCQVRICVNPKHLEAVTPKENTRRRFTSTPPELLEVKSWLQTINT